jgi:hypothetical protein
LSQNQDAEGFRQAGDNKTHSDGALTSFPEQRLRQSVLPTLSYSPSYIEAVDLGTRVLLTALQN